MARTDQWPEGHEFIRQLRETLGMFAGAMPISPKQAWEEALDRVRNLNQGTCSSCLARESQKRGTRAVVPPPRTELTGPTADLYRRRTGKPMYADELDAQ